MGNKTLKERVSEFGEGDRDWCQFGSDSRIFLAGNGNLNKAVKALSCSKFKFQIAVIHLHISWKHP